MPSQKLMLSWWFFNVTLLAAGAVTLALSIVWRQSNVLMNMILPDMDLTGACIYPLQLTMGFPRLPLLPWFSWACSRHVLPRYLGGLGRGRDPEEPHHRWPCPPELVTDRRYALLDRGRDGHLVLYSSHTGQLPRSLVKADPQHPDCNPGHGQLIRFSRLPSPDDLCPSSSAAVTSTEQILLR